MPKKYKLTDLKYEAGQVKRHVLNKVRKGKIKKITKKDTFVLISQRPRLELKSDRTLWNGEAKEYLDSWYCKLIEEIECIQSESYIEIAASIEQNNVFMAN